MHLISTGKKTVLSDFADLETISEYVHTNGESTDFQFSAQRRVFVEVDKKSGLAVMRIKEKQERAPEIQRVRKLTIDNVFCVGCAKQNSELIAVGQTGGCVKLYNYRVAQLMHRFPADQTRSSIIYVDFNNTDEYLAGVHETGTINIYGTKTKTKMELLTMDNNTTLARFHPGKRFQLAAVSYKGAVTLYDVQSKRKIFNASAHDAPCRDISMCSAQPTLLVSVGYDCKINIFDTRRKAQSASGRLTYTHPLSTVALSECGTYFCAGNLKGELISYDMRSTKAPLAVRSVHECAVTRIAFVPMPSEEQSASGSLSSMGNVTIDAASVSVSKPIVVEQVPSATEELRKSIAANLINTQQQLETIGSLGYGSALATPAATAISRIQRDSFCDFLDAQGPRGLDRMSTRLATTATQRRDSFDWETLHRKSSNEERQSLCQAGSNLSSIDSINSSTADSCDAKLQQTLSGALRDRSNISVDAKLKQITETDEQSELQEQSDNYSVASSNTGSDKENAQFVNMDLKRRLRLLPASRNSTPQAQPAQQAEQELKPQQLLPSTASGISALDCNADVRKELSELRAFVDERFQQLETELKYTSETNKWQIFTQVANYWNQQLDNTQEIRDALALLLQTDRFMQEYSRLELENQLLRAQLQKLMSDKRVETKANVND